MTAIELPSSRGVRNHFRCGRAGCGSKRLLPTAVAHTRVSWTEVISTAFGRIQLLGFAGIIRVLHRIEQAILETRAALLIGLSVGVKAAQHTKESI